MGRQSNYYHQFDGTELEWNDVVEYYSESSRPQPDIESICSGIKGKNLSEEDKAFLQSKLESDVEFLYKVLEYAIMTACADVCDYLINNYSLNVNHATDVKYPLLKLACKANEPEVEVLRCVRLLISKGGDVNPEVYDGVSPLMECFQSGFSEVAELLISHGADVNAKDTFGSTCLSYAVFTGGKENMVRMLLDHGAQKDVKDFRDRKPRDIAVMRGYNEIALLLTSEEDAETSNENYELDKDEDPLGGSIWRILRSLGRYSFIIYSILKRSGLDMCYKKIMQPNQTNAKYSTKVYIICGVIGCSAVVCLILKKWGSFI